MITYTRHSQVSRLVGSPFGRNFQRVFEHSVRSLTLQFQAEKDLSAAKLFALNLGFTTLLVKSELTTSDQPFYGTIPALLFKQQARPEYVDLSHVSSSQVFECRFYFLLTD